MITMNLSDSERKALEHDFCNARKRIMATHPAFNSDVAVPVRVDWVKGEIKIGVA